MAPELRGSCLARRQGSSSDLRSVREKAQIAAVRKGSTVPRPLMTCEVLSERGSDKPSVHAARASSMLRHK